MARAREIESTREHERARGSTREHEGARDQIARERESISEEK
jgi:hypothetical protein